MTSRLATVLVAALLAAGCEKEAPAPQRPAPQVTIVTVKPQSIAVHRHLRRADRELAPAMGGGWVDASDAIANPSMGPRSNTPSGSR